jgi:hypothetical protein
LLQLLLLLLWVLLVLLLLLWVLLELLLLLLQLLLELHLLLGVQLKVTSWHLWRAHRRHHGPLQGAEVASI